jgi:hypothetical protein
MRGKKDILKKQDIRYNSQKNVNNQIPIIKKNCHSEFSSESIGHYNKLNP